MLYRENGQFKSSYASDQQMLPILQDRVFMLLLLAFAFVVVPLLAGLIAAVVGVLFGIPSLRIKGLYLAVATLAAQFFSDWLFARVKWFTNYAHSGSVQTAPIELFGWTINSPA